MYKALLLSNALGGVGTIVQSALPATCLSIVLEDNSLVLAYAAPYLRIQALSTVPTLGATTCFSSLS